MRLTFLGTGSTSAPPLYGCDCPVCLAARANPQHKRRPASALVEADGERLLLDAGVCDLSERFPPGSFDAFLLTHFHPDHVQGLFPLRWGVGETIPAYCPPDSEGCADLFKHPGLLDFRRVHKFESFSVGNIRITPVPLIHSKPTLGYCLEYGATRIAYLTDTAGLPPASLEFLRQWQPSAMVLDCSFPPREIPSKNHCDLTVALQLIHAVSPKHAWLTHIGHELDLWLRDNAASLPGNVSVARDGMTIPS